MFQDEIHKFTKEEIQNLRQFYESKHQEGFEEFLAAKPSSQMVVSQVKVKKQTTRAPQNPDTEPLI